MTPQHSASRFLNIPFCRHGGGAGLPAPLPAHSLTSPPVHTVVPLPHLPPHPPYHLLLPSHTANEGKHQLWYYRYAAAAISRLVAAARYHRWFALRTFRTRYYRLHFTVTTYTFLQLPPLPCALTAPTNILHTWDYPSAGNGGAATFALPLNTVHTTTVRAALRCCFAWFVHLRFRFSPPFSLNIRAAPRSTYVYVWRTGLPTCYAALSLPCWTLSSTVPFL